MADDKDKPTELNDSCDLQTLRKDLDSNTELLREVLRLNGRLTKAMEQMIHLDTKVSDISETQNEIQVTLGKQQSMIETLMSWHNSQKALGSALGWLIDKAPRLAAMAVFCFWVLSQWSTKGGGDK